MASLNTDSLRIILANAVGDLPKSDWKRMFGCDAVFADGTIFGLVWKTGRIGVKLPDESDFNALIKTKGSAPWKAGTMTMAHWVLVPEGFHKDEAKLSQWVRRAHALALLNPKTSAKSKKSTSKRPKTPVARTKEKKAKK